METSNDPLDFENTFQQIINDLSSINLAVNSVVKDEADNYSAWMQKCVMYNVVAGKKMRAQLLVKTFRALVPDATDEEMYLARVLGCLVELLHAAFLVADDIMDRGETRRGQPCWYLKIKNEGIALNDSFALENLTYQLLKKYFGHHKCYGQLLDLMLNVSYKTIFGQGMDTAAELKQPCEFTENLYFAIATYKTGYYTVYLPVALAMTFATIDNVDGKTQDFWSHVQNICLEMGLLFQVQDDILDLYGDSNKTGKALGSDVQAGKCTWLFVQAQKLCSEEQLKLLYGNYGQPGNEKVDTVKQLYEDLKLYEKFLLYEKTVYNKLRKSILNLKSASTEHALNTFLDLMSFRKF